MEGVIAGLAAVLCAVASYISVFSLTDSSRRRSDARASQRLLERAAELFEYVGHRPRMVRLGNKGPIPAWTRRVNAILAARGVGLTRYGCFSLMVLVCLTGGLAGLVISRSVLGLIVGIVGTVSAFVACVGRFEAKSAAKAANQMPEVLRSLSSALAAGKSLPQAIEYVGRNLSEPMGSQFLKTSFQIKSGKAVEEAIDELCSRVKAPGMDLLGTALQISQRTGSSLDDLFLRTSQMVFATVALKRELMVKTSQVRLSSKVVSVIPALLAALLTLLSPDYRAGVLTQIGGACLCIAALLDIGALMAIRSMLQRSMR